MSPRTLTSFFADLSDRPAVLSFLTMSYLSIVLVPAALTAVCLLARISPPWIAIQVVLALTIFALYRIHLHTLPGSGKWTVLGLFAASLLLAALCAGWLYDVSWDGITYHSEAIVNILHNVNPIYTSIPGNYPLWTNHYPKTIWYFAAAIGGAYHRLELGKAYDFILIYAAFVYAWIFFGSLLIGRRASLLLAACAALNPIAASQIVSFYVDGASASLLTMLVLAGVAQLRRPAALDRIVFIAAAAAVATTKFTGAVYAGLAITLVFAALLLASFRTSKALTAVRPFSIMIAVILVAVLVLGFNPYVTNMLQGNHPLYPVLGRNRVVVISGAGEGPNEFFQPHRNRFQNFAASLLSTTSDAHGAEHPTPKIPFTVHYTEIKAATNSDLRMAGWGVLFSGVLFCSLLLYLFSQGWRRTPAISFALLLVLVTASANPHAWWARFTPQIALLPVLLLAPCLVAPSRMLKLLASAVGVLFLLNSLLFLALAVGNSLKGTLRTNRSLGYAYSQCGSGNYWVDGSKALIRYDMLPPNHGVVITVKRQPTQAQLAAAVHLPIDMVKDVEDTLYSDHCATPQPH